MSDWTTVESKGDSRPGSKPAVQRSPIPKALVKRGNNMATNRSKPAGNKGGKRGPRGGWRSITAGDAADYGLKAWKLAKHLATLINVEDKKWDVDGSSGTVITTTPLVVNLSNIAQGNDYGNRSGDSILGQAVEFRACAVSNTASQQHFLRVLIVCDRENHGADPVLGDVLQGGSLAFVQPVYALMGERFAILYDELIAMNTTNNVTASGTTASYAMMSVKLPTLVQKFNRHLRYIGTTGADASNWEGALFLIATSTDASNGPKLHYSFRLHFTDN